MIDASERFHLLVEFAHGPIVGGEVIQHLDHNLFGGQLFVLREVDCAETAATDFARDPVAAAQRLAGVVDTPRRDRDGLGIRLGRDSDTLS
jgi:hypothetical protein